MNNTSTVLLTEMLTETMQHNQTMIPHSINVIRCVCVVLWSIIVVIGLFGNCLTIAVLVGPKLNNSSTTLYLTALALIDIMYLIFSVGGQIYNFSAIFPGSIRQLHFSLCICLSILLYSLTYISVWLLVAVAIDRMIWVIFPFSAKVICTRNIAKLVVFLLGVFFICLDLHFIWTLRYRSLEPPRRGDCSLRPDSIFKSIFGFMDLALIMGLPFLIMFSANILIIAKLRQMERFRKRMKTSHKQPLPPPQESLIEANKQIVGSEEIINNTVPAKDKTVAFEKSKRSTRRISRDKQTTSLTKMLLSVNIFFLVSTTPLLIYNLVQFVTTLPKMILRMKYLVIVIFGLEKLLYTLWYLNFAVHFLLYCMSGPKFRQEALRLLNKYCCFWNYLLAPHSLSNNNNRTAMTNESHYFKTYAGIADENRFCKERPTISSANQNKVEKNITITNCSPSDKVGYHLINATDDETNNNKILIHETIL